MRMCMLVTAARAVWLCNVAPPSLPLPLPTPTPTPLPYPYVYCYPYLYPKP